MFYHNLSDTDTILTRVSARLQQPQNTDRRRRYSKAVALLLLFTVSFATLLTGLRAVNANAVHTSFTHSQQAKAKAHQINFPSTDLVDSMIRLHVIANSNSTADQTLKYQVRDAIINELQQDLANAADPQEAEQRICAEKDYIMNTAEQVIRSHGFSYPVSVSLEDRYFPTKQYGDLTFPPGTYRALCVEIGKSEGRNWWCVLFPCLCFVDETTAVVPENSKQKLKQHIQPLPLRRQRKKRHRLLPRSRFTPASMTGLPLTSQIGVETNSLTLRIYAIISLREKQGGYFFG